MPSESRCLNLFRPWSCTLAFIILLPLLAIGDVSPYFKTNSTLPASYIASFGKIKVIRINKPNQIIKLQTQNGIVVKATVENWREYNRITAEYVLEGQQYRLSKVLYSNIGTYFSESAPIKLSTDMCSFDSSEVEKISALIDDEKFSGGFVDETCKDLNAMEKKKLLKLRYFLNPSSTKGEGLLKCLADLTTKQNDSKKKDQLIDLRAALVSTMKKELSGHNTRISCSATGNKPSSQPNQGIIAFPIKDGKIDVKQEDIDETFLHEFVHVSHPLGLIKNYEEKLADYVASSCTGKEEKAEKGFFVDLQDTLPEASKATKKMPVKVKEAVAAVPVQKIDEGAVESLQQMAATTNTENADSLNSGLNSIVEKPVRTFSDTTNRIASILVPSAEASNVVARTSYEPPAKSSNRSPASESVVETGAENFKALSKSSNSEKLVEEIIVPTADGNSYSSSILESPKISESQLIGRELIKATNANEKSELASSSNQNTNLQAVVGSARSSLTGDSGTGPSSRGPASVGGSPNALQASNSGNSIDGVSFPQSNVTGSGYQQYQSKVKNAAFKRSLEDAGILITKDGSLVSRPKTVVVTYIDNGSALIYGGL